MLPATEHIPEVKFLELKYCERCGGLWLRLRGSCQSYCPACNRRMGEWPLPPNRTPDSASLSYSDLADERRYV